MTERLRQQARDAREGVRTGRFRGAALWEVLEAVPFSERDGWLDELLALPELPGDGAELPRDAVPYLPCGVEAIRRAVAEAPVRPTDVFVDLGAGLGRAAILAHLLTGARAVGVELQPHLVANARAAADRLNLDAVRFLQGDAAVTQVPEGTVFFIYASFGQAALARVLAWLETVALRRQVTLCAVDFELHGYPWLRSRASGSPELVFYDSAPPA